MASDRQIAANRRNAKRSTGPRTGAGKRRSRRNALRHGLTAKSVAVQWGESPEAYEHLRRDLLDDYRPETALGCQIVDELAYVTLQLRRCQDMENNILDNAMFKGVLDTTTAFQQIFAGQGDAAERLEEVGAKLLNGESMRTGVRSSAAHMLFGPDPLQTIGRNRTSLQRERERLLDQLERAERMKVRSCGDADPE